jgi:ketosteroid isomerase-like protein
MNKKSTSLFFASLLIVSFLMTSCTQTQSYTGNPNVEVVQGIYDAFAAGDGGAVLATFSPEIVWNEAESNSLADGNPYVGPQAVAEGVFGRIGQEWETFNLTDQTLYEVGEDMVMATGRYEGTHAGTGKSINAQHVHIWWFENGMVTQFQQYVDTKQLADAEAE